MRTRGPHHGQRTPALLGGVVAVAAVALFAFSPPVRAGSTTVPRDRSSSVPSVSGGSPAAPEQALHRVHAGTAGAAVRLAHPGGCLPVPDQPVAAARCDGRPGDSFGVATPTSGPPVRILFCTWLN
jgi:hypothetical protein